MTKQTLLLMSCTALLLTACGGGGGGSSSNDFDPTAGVPTAVTTDSTLATAYVGALTEEPESRTDTLEPISALPDSLATSDTAEPIAIPE